MRHLPIRAGGLAILLLSTCVLAQDQLRYLGDEVTTRAFMLDLATLFQAETGIEVRMAITAAESAIEATADGRADLGGTSQPVLAEALRPELIHYTIAWDALALIAHPGNRVTAIGKDELRAVLTGAIANWSQLGGAAAEIKLYLPEHTGSGVGYTLRRQVLGDSQAALAADLTYDNLEDLQTAVAAVPNALGITAYSRAMAFEDLPVTVLAYAGVQPNPETIAAGEYLLFQPLYLVARPDNQLAERFVRFAQGSLAKRIMRRGDIVPYMDGFRIIARQFERENRLRRAQFNVKAADHREQ